MVSDELRHLRERVGSPSLATIVARVERGGGTVSRSHLSEILNGKARARPELAVRIAEALGANADEVAAVRIAAATRQPMPKTTPAGLRTWRVRDFTPEIAAVHPAIGTDSLPAYVPRQHDAEVRRRLRAAAEHGGFVLLTGPSCSGKTRSAWEAIQADFGDTDRRVAWPRDAAELSALLASSVTSMIVWLDETQRYLSAEVLAYDLRTARPGLALIGTMWQSDYASLTSRSADRPGDGHARDLLDVADKPIRVDERFSLREQTEARRVAANDPVVAEALRNREFGLTQTLAGGPWLVQRWQQPAYRYTTAVITAAMDIDQLTHSGQRTHRPGEPPPIFGLVNPAALREAAPAYFTDRRAAPPDWFERALDEATTLIRDAVSPLIPIRHHVDPGRTVGYVVADFLADYRRRRVASVPIPEQTWDALIRNTDDDEVLRGITSEAEYRHLLRQAEACHRHAGENGKYGLILQLRKQGRRDELEAMLDGSDGDAYWRIELLKEFGRTDELSRLAEGGSSEAGFVLARMRLDQDDVAGAITNLRRTSHAYHRSQLAELLLRNGDLEAAIAEATRDADPAAMVKLADHLIENGMKAQAMDLLALAVRTPDDSGSTRFADASSWAILLRPAGDALIRLARLQAAGEDADAAVESYTRLAEQGYPDAREELVQLLLDRGDLATLADRSRAGDDVAMHALIEYHADQGNRSDAIAVVDDCAAHVDDPYVRVSLGYYLIQLGEVDRGRDLVVASGGEPTELARALISAGREPEGIRLLRDAVLEQPTSWGAYELGRLLRARGRGEDADDVLATLAAAGHPWAVLDQAETLAKRGAKDKAIELLTDLVMSNPPDLSEPQPRGHHSWEWDEDNYWRTEDEDYEMASSRLANLLVDTRRPEELRRLAEIDPGQRWRYADLMGELGDEEELRTLARMNTPNAPWRLSDLLAGRGDLDGLFTEAAAGNAHAVDALVKAYRQADALPEAVRRLRALTDSGSETARSRLIDLLVEQGDTTEAVLLLTRQIVCRSSGHERLTRLLTDHGMTRTLENYLRYGLNPDGSIANRF